MDPIPYLGELSGVTAIGAVTSGGGWGWKGRCFVLPIGNKDGVAEFLGEN